MKLIEVKDSDHKRDAKVKYSLIGLTINKVLITPKTKNERWLGAFNCSDMSVESLVGAPNDVKLSFACANNGLTSLKGAPRHVGKYFNCSHNELPSLKGAPDTVVGAFYCSYNNLSSLEGAPGVIKSNFYCSGNEELRSLKDVHKHVKEINGTFYARLGCDIMSHVLGVLYIKGCGAVELGSVTNGAIFKVNEIINKHLKEPYGHKRVFECQCELQDAGLDEYAQL